MSSDCSVRWQHMAAKLKGPIQTPTQITQCPDVDARLCRACEGSWAVKLGDVSMISASMRNLNLESTRM